MAAGDISKALRDRVRAHLGEPSQEGILSSDIYAFLNLAQHNVVRRLNDNAMPEMCAIATGSLSSSMAALPATFVRERFVEIGATNIRARRWDISELDALDNNTLTEPSSSNPYYFIWYSTGAAGLRLQVDVGLPTSTLGYRLHYVKQPTDMSDSVDPVLSAEKHGLLVSYALWLAWHQLEEPKEAERQWAEYVKQVNRINSRHSRRTGRRRNEAQPGDAA